VTVIMSPGEHCLVLTPLAYKLIDLGTCPTGT